MLQLERTGTRAAKTERLQTAAKSSRVRLVPGVFACAQCLTGSLACSRMEISFEAYKLTAEHCNGDFFSHSKQFNGRPRDKKAYRFSFFLDQLWEKKLAMPCTYCESKDSPCAWLKSSKIGSLFG
jgi:hypothetical protein